MSILGLVTYTMDLAGFHDYLESVVFVNGEYRRDLLHQHAVKVFNEASEQTKEIFEDLRIDEEDLEDKDPEIADMDGDWYLIALVPHLQPNRIVNFLKTMYIGWDILKIAGWEDEQCHALLIGSGMMNRSQGIVTHNNSVFMGKIWGPIEGWMDRPTIEYYRQKFIKAKPYFYQDIPLPSDAIGSFTKLHLTDESARETYQEVLQMLETPLARGHEMLLTWVE